MLRNAHNIARYSTLAIVISCISACTALKNTAYTPVQTDLPTTFNNTHVNTPSTTTLQNQWWRQFQDPNLSATIELALRKNQNLAVAALKVQQAILQARLSDSQKLPTANTSASTTNNRNLDNGEHSDSQNIKLSTSYEIDLFGKLKNQSNAAAWEAEATSADLQASRIALVSTVANLYWQIAFLNQQIANETLNLNDSKVLLKIVQARHQAGAVSGIEVAQATQNIASIQSTLSYLAQQRLENKNALGLLLDDPSLASIKEIQYLPQIPLPEIATGIPATTLANRPDMHAAELRLRKALATTNATKASYYPNIELTGALGSSSSTLVNLLKNPILTLGAGITLPFLQYKDMQRNIAISNLNYSLAIISYRQTLYQALVDTNNALSARSQLALQATAQIQQLQAAKTVDKLTNIRYHAGAVGLKIKLDAESAKRNAEIQLAQAQLNQLNNLMLIYKNIASN